MRRNLANYAMRDAVKYCILCAELRRFFKIMRFLFIINFPLNLRIKTEAP